MTTAISEPLTITETAPIAPAPVAPTPCEPGRTDHESVLAQINRLMTLRTPDAIAAFFRREGVKGVRAVDEECVIARWLTDTCGGPVEVGSCVIDISGSDTREHIACLSGAVIGFISKFDEGVYPDLFMSTP